jgi:hypothetical protein
MRIRVPLPFAASLAVLLTVSCSNPGFVCGCSPARDVAVVYGTVTDPAGAAVAGAPIVAERGAPGCVAPLREIGEPTVSRADGSYRVLVFDGASPGECLRASATPPAGSALAASEAVPFAVHFAPNTPTDSARVDLVLRAP